MVEKRCKSAQMSSKCWSIILKFCQNIVLQLAKSDCTGFRITSDIAVTTGVVFGPQQACNTPAGGCIKMYSFLAK